MSGLSSKPDPKSGPGMSFVGGPSVHEADGQRTVPDSEKNKAARFQKGKEHSHLPNDSTDANEHPEDERSIANRLANEQKKSEDDAGRTSTKGLKAKESKLAEDDPTAPAKLHGHEPSRGAQVDKEIADEEAEMVAKKDAEKK